MCGIVGSYPACEVKLDYIKHRGPDGTGRVVLPKIAIGHTRLAIVDLSERGAQPRWSSDGNVLLSYNGEIYNYKSLYSRQETSDTVALVEWLARMGPSFDPTALNGMYAFAAYFLKEEYLVLSRDAAGIKPLYIASSRDGQCLAFSSEIKGLFGIEWFDPQPNLDVDVQREFIQYGYAFPRPVQFRFRHHEVSLTLVPTLMEGVYHICPGQTIILSLESEPISRFSTHVKENRDPSLLLGESVREQSISDVEVGVQMSGGIDSSLVAYHYATNNSSVHGFYVSVPYRDLCEDQWAHRAAETLTSVCDFKFHQINASRSEIKRVLPSVLWYMDEPAIRHPNAAAVYLLCEYVQRETQVKVLLTGEGADEMFAGYEWHDGRTFEEYDRSRRLFDLGGSQSARTLLSRNAHRPILESQLVYDRAVYLPPILARQDRMSMAHSIEARVPFLSNGFLAMPFPTAPGKRVLKDEAARVFGRDFANRPKCGFGIPWKWLGDFAVPSGTLGWLRDSWRPRNAPQRWTMTALGMWAQDYLFDGWRAKSQISSPERGNVASSRFLARCFRRSGLLKKAIR